ncbi:uncharacterized protein LOC129602478, partial [Paramacrobiotus metropolitanus]|uniref:uncharacterized protein LOC129602478 n=1 Tax=Paramacrobiotus metropolitanus TaxID=2943436 RepID=UPI0024461FEC
MADSTVFSPYPTRRQRSHSCNYGQNIIGCPSKNIVTVEQLVQCPAIMANIVDTVPHESAARILSTMQKLWIADTVLEQLTKLHCNDICGMDFLPNHVLISRHGALLQKRGRVPSHDGNVGKHHDKAVRVLLYSAPEDIRHDNKDGRSSDVWSFACLCLYVFSGKDPEFYHQLANGQKRFLNQVKGAFAAITMMVGKGDCIPEYAMCYQNSPAMQALFCQCFQFIALQRPGAFQLRQDMVLAQKEALLQCGMTKSGMKTASRGLYLPLDDEFPHLALDVVKKTVKYKRYSSHIGKDC